MFKNRYVTPIFLGLFALSVHSPTWAESEGFSLGLNGGNANVHYRCSNYSWINNAWINKNGLAGRAYMGYQFTENLGAELGFAQFSPVRFRKINGTEEEGKIRQRAIDLVGKVSYTFENFNCDTGLDIYLRVGLAYSQVNRSFNLSEGDDHAGDVVVGVGLSYDVTPHFPVEIGYSRYEKFTGNLGNVDFFFLGVAYRFNSDLC